MENEKKPSRLGVRLSAIMVAVMLVVCMAVPAFAVSGTYPSDYPDVPFDAKWVLISTAQPTLIRPGIGSYYSGSGSSWRLYLSSGGQVNSLYAYVLENGAWVERLISSSALNFSDYNGTALPSKIIWTNMDVELLPDRIVFIDPPPDPMSPFNSGLIVVLDWVGSVVSAVVSGPMSGLLILLAVPVAITLLLVAFIVIRRIIWGA